MWKIRGNVENLPRPGNRQTKGIKDDLWTGVARVKMGRRGRREEHRRCGLCCSGCGVGRTLPTRVRSLFLGSRERTALPPCGGWRAEAWATPRASHKKRNDRLAMLSPNLLGYLQTVHRGWRRTAPSLCRVRTLINRETGRCHPHAARWGTGRTRSTAPFCRRKAMRMSTSRRRAPCGTAIRHPRATPRGVVGGRVRFLRGRSVGAAGAAWLPA
jgi:hypothetical protein